MTYNGFKKLAEAVTDVLNTSTKVPGETNGYIPVVTVTYLAKRKASVGVQFWTAEQIKAGVRENTDRTASHHIQNLY